MLDAYGVQVQVGDYARMYLTPVFYGYVIAVHEGEDRVTVRGRDGHVLSAAGEDVRVSLAHRRGTAREV